MTDISSNEIKSIVQSIVSDPIFATGGPYKTIIQYLYECYQKNHVPTEIDIAINVFDKKDNFNPNEDTLVRVNLYRLRKKLNEYYNDHGKSDPIRLRIPKGHHTLEFTQEKNPYTFWKKSIYPKNLIIIFSFIFLVTVIIVLWSQIINFNQDKYSKNSVSSNSIIWSDFINSDLNTSIVIGELFTFYVNKQEYNREWLIRDDQINSYEELRSFIDQTDLVESDYYLPGWDIVPKSAAYNLLKISNVLSHIYDRLNVKITSEVKLDNIRTDNIIYIGHFHNLKHLGKYLPGSTFHPSTVYSSSDLHPERNIRVTADGIDTLYNVIFQYDQKSALNSDYVLISKVPGPNNNIFLFIISFQSLGRLEIIKMLSQEKLHAQLSSEIQQFEGGSSPFFELLIEVNGYEETGFESKVIHFFPIP
jgi:hypothetical protein